MGHLAAKDVYRKLGKKIDNLAVRAPWNESLYAILKELYTADEAEVVVKMPYGLAKFESIQKNTRFEETKLRSILESLSAKGLIIDLWHFKEYRYMVSPMIVGIFEFTMMRTGDNVNSKEWARLFHAYLHGDDSFYKSNFGRGSYSTPMRALPHEETVETSAYVEVLDYEKASEIVGKAKKFSIGICSCRHEKLHVGKKTCEAPLESCSSFGRAADYLIRHNLAKEVSKSEMQDNLARARDMGLVLLADNVQKNISFICQCCDCCCNVLLGISKFGYPNIVVTSGFIADADENACAGCGDCAEACPVDAIRMTSSDHPDIDSAMCIGCGVCALRCDTGAMRLAKRKKRIIPPENTFERVIMQCLDRGNIQFLIFNNPQSITQAFMRGFIGGFFKLTPVKRAVMSDMFRSRFLESLKKIM